MVQEVVEQIENTIKDVMASNLHTAFPAKITALDLESGKVNVLPIGSYYNNGQELEYPEIPSIPLILNANPEREFACVQPVKEGDTVLVVCSEQSLSAFLTDTAADQMDERYELQNGIAIPGLQKEGIEAQLEANEEDAWILQYGETKIKVTAEGIEITGGLSLEGDVTVTGDVTMTGTTTVSGNLHVSGNITCGGTYPGYGS